MNGPRFPGLHKELEYPRGHIWRQDPGHVSFVLRVREQLGIGGEFVVGQAVTPAKRLRIVEAA